MDEAHERSRRTIAVLSPDYLTSPLRPRPSGSPASPRTRPARDDLLVPVRVRPCEPTACSPRSSTLTFRLAEETARQRLLTRRQRRRREARPDRRSFPDASRHAAEKPRFPFLPTTYPRPTAPSSARGRARRLARALAAGGRAGHRPARPITGLGGIGKTQTRAGLRLRHLADYDLVRWLRAEEPATLAADYAALAPALGLDPATPDQPTQIAAVRAQLERTPRWLLVFDNAPDPPWCGTTSRAGATGGCSLTSRRRRLARHRQGRCQLDLLPRRTRVALLSGAGARAPRGEPTEAAALAGELGYLPLALAQARAYLDELAVDFPTYRQRLRESPRVLATAAAAPTTRQRRHRLAGLDRGRRARAAPRRGPLLELLAFLAPDADAAQRLLGAEPEALPEALRDAARAQRRDRRAHRFSLIRADAGSITVHRLVQAVTRDALDAATAKTRAEAAVRLVNAALPRPPQEHTNWPVIGTLLPHALAAADAAERLGTGLETAAIVLNETALYHQARAAWAEAEPLYERALAIGEKALGPDHPDLATRLNNLAELYRATGRLAEAEPLLERALAIGEKALGPHHPDIAIGSTTSPSSTGPPAASPRPSRSYGAPSRSSRRSFPPIIRTWRLSAGISPVSSPSGTATPAPAPRHPNR